MKEFFSHKFNRILVIIIAIFLLIAIIGVVGVILMTNSGTVGATINGNEVNWYKKSEKALENVSLTLYGDTNLAFAESDYKIAVEITGQSSGVKYTATNSNDVSGWLSSFQNAVGISNIDVEGNTFNFNSADFQPGEVLLIKATFDKSKNLLDQNEANLSYRYYAVTAGTVAIEQETEVAEPTEETNSDADEVSESESEVASTVSPSAKVFFNGFLVPTYGSKSEALASPLEINTNETPITAEPNEVTKRIRIWTENQDGKSAVDELFLWEENEFTGTLSFEPYSDATVLVCISIETNSINIDNQYQYFAVKVP